MNKTTDLLIQMTIPIRHVLHLFQTNFRNNQTIIKFAVSGVLFLTGGLSQAEFRYNAIQADYVFGEYEYDNADVGYKGYEVSIQFEISPSIVAGLNYQSLEGSDRELLPSGIDTLEYEKEGFDVFLFYYSPLTAQTHLLFGVIHDMQEIDARLQGVITIEQENEDSDYLFAGFRHQLRGLEFQGQWFYQLDSEKDKDKWHYTLGLVSGASGQLQLGFSISPDSLNNAMSVFVRQTF